MDTTVMHMVESGEADYLIKKWFPQHECKAKKTFYSLDILRLKDLFIILVVSILVATFLLFIEIIWHKLQ